MKTIAEKMMADIDTFMECASDHQKRCHPDNEIYFDRARWSYGIAWAAIKHAAMYEKQGLDAESALNN